MLPYSYIDPLEKNMPLPQPKVNGGWYTGTPAKEGGGYGNVSVVPEAHVFMEKLQEANAPPFAIAHTPSDTRPGNNVVTAPYHQTFEMDAKKYNLRCIYRPTPQAPTSQATTSSTFW